MTTPTTPEGMAQYDDLPPAEAVVLAWTNPGDHPAWHRDRQAELRKAMPLLARALDRLAEYERTPPHRRRPHRRSRPPLWETDEGGHA